MSNDNDMNNDIDWSGVLRKEAIGTGGVDLGEVYGVGDAYIITQKGLSDKKWYHIPKTSAESFDGNVLRLKVNESELLSFERTEAQEIKDDYNTSANKPSSVSQETETKIPLMGENIDVVKNVTEEKINLVKEPVRETRTVEIELTREEISIETRPASKDSYSNPTSVQSSDSGSPSPIEGPVEFRTEISIPLRREEPVIIKTPYVKEEIVVKKKPVTETKSITEDVTYERAKYENRNGVAENK